MANFTYSPGQYYTRNPTAQTSLNPFSGLGASTTAYGVNNNVGVYSGYNPQIPNPGTVGYRLPSQSYANYGVNNPTNFGIQTLKTTLVNSAINATVGTVLDNLTGNDPSSTRLLGSGLSQGGVSSDILQPSNDSSNSAFMDDTETRVLIYDQTGQFIGESEVFRPLMAMAGVLFPYTPTIQVAHKASYDMMSLVHTNYVTPQYQHSQIDNISIQGVFTANYPAEAEYMMAMLHFFRTVTKMFYGKGNLTGTPPPVLYLDAYGPYAFDHIPVVITGFDYTFPNDVDYISCSTNGQTQRVPTSLSVNLSMVPTYSRNNISNNFGLTEFSNGSLITGAGGGRTRTGGWL